MDFAAGHAQAATELSAGSRWSGFTLVELLITVAIAAIVLTVAIPSYRFVVNRSGIQTAKQDLTAISLAIEHYLTRFGKLPAELSEVFTKPDPWGNPYEYLDMAGASVGKVRKDKSLHPLNSDYDLYSKGPDGKSASPLTAQISRDDIIRANNGAFIGIAEDY